MFRAAPRLIARPTALRAAPRTFASPSRRQISTAPPSQQRRSWKSLFARIGIAGTLIYYYNTTEVFAEEPRQAVVQIPDTDVESERLPTIEALSAERQKRKAVQAQLDAQQQKQADAAAKAPQGGIEGLEEEADQQGAFNPETGEINWDCPCLGGMAHGPCGDEFKAAFSCFVYSSEEPKGMDCIDKFKDMQNCFREYPDIYGSELDSDADDEDELTADAASDPSAPASTPPSSVGGESEAQHKAPMPETIERKPSGDNKPKAQDSTPAPAPTSRSTSSEKQSPPSPPASTQGKLSGESGEKPNTSSSSTSLVPDAYKPDAKE